MMSGVIVKELQSVGIAFLSGAVITFVYDLLRIFRRVISHGNVWIGVEDFVFWVWTSFWIFSVLYRENDGAIRLYTILAMFLGMLSYHRMLSEIFVRVTGRILRKIVRVIKYPLKKCKVFAIFFGKKLKKLIKHIIIKENR